jgi:hypothetical protein
LPLYLAGMKFRMSYFAKPSAPGAMPALLAAPTGDFNTVDDARKAAVADADKIGAADSIIIDPIGERWVKGERLVRTDSGWQRVPEPER